MVIGGKYELLELAGQGGMASVWRGVARGAAGFARPVAVKMIRPEFKADADYIAMFVEEARVGAELMHPHIVQVFDFGVDERQAHYLVMEWIDGLSLATYVHAYAQHKVPTPWIMVTAMVLDALRGLGAAHARTHVGQPAPVIHRDLSPENILVGLNGIAKLTDFGLARAKDRVARLTRPGTVKGKVGYLAPERTIGQPGSVRSDVFSMGVVLWEALAGRSLFKGETTQVLRQIMNGQIESLLDVRSDLPRPLVAAVHRALQPEQQRRYPSAQHFADALTAVLRQVKQLSEVRIGGSVMEARMRLAGLPPPAHAATTPALGLPKATRKPG